MGNQRSYKLRRVDDLRSGMVFRTDVGRGQGSYMIISNDKDREEDDNYYSSVRWIVVWFINNKHSETAPGLSFHGRGEDDQPRTSEEMFSWIDDDHVVGYIDRDVMRDIIEATGLED